MLLLLKRLAFFLFFKSTIEVLFLTRWNKSLSLKKGFALSFVAGITAIAFTIGTLLIIKHVSAAALASFDFRYLKNHTTFKFLTTIVVPLVYLLCTNIVIFRSMAQKIKASTHFKKVCLSLLVGLLSSALLFSTLYHVGAPVLCFLHL